MKRISLLLCLILQTSLASFAQNAKQFPFRDESLPVNDRIEDLLGRLTLEQKISLMVHDNPEIETLGIKSYNWWNEALHGVARKGLATVFPQAIALAATFDDVMHLVRKVKEHFLVKAELLEDFKRIVCSIKSLFHILFA